LNIELKIIRRLINIIMHCRWILFFILIGQVTLGQVSSNSNVFFAKEYSKEIALYNAKEFVIRNVLGESIEAVKFQIDALASASSGELTSLTYTCKKKKKEGLILGFYNENWNYAGVVYSAYAFKNLPKDSATILLDKIELLINDYKDYLQASIDYYNLYFQYDDMIFLIYKSVSGSIRIRVMWNDFDSDWDFNAFKRTKKRFLEN